MIDINLKTKIFKFGDLMWSKDEQEFRLVSSSIRKEDTSAASGGELANATTVSRRPEATPRAVIASGPTNLLKATPQLKAPGQGGVTSSISTARHEAEDTHHSSDLPSAATVTTTPPVAVSDLEHLKLHMHARRLLMRYKSGEIASHSLASLLCKAVKRHQVVLSLPVVSHIADGLFDLLFDAASTDKKFDRDLGSLALLSMIDAYQPIGKTGQLRLTAHLSWMYQVMCLVDCPTRRSKKDSWRFALLVLREVAELRQEQRNFVFLPSAVLLNNVEEITFAPRSLPSLRLCSRSTRYSAQACFLSTLEQTNVVISAHGWTDSRCFGPEFAKTLVQFAPSGKCLSEVIYAVPVTAAFVQLIIQKVRAMEEPMCTLVDIANIVTALYRRNLHSADLLCMVLQHLHRYCQSDLPRGATDGFAKKELLALLPLLDIGCMKLKSMERKQIRRMIVHMLPLKIVWTSFHRTTVVPITVGLLRVSQYSKFGPWGCAGAC
ncbi:MAG: hypothetical protein MHM6MM_001568 [Cercozoa sp. M6MM]